MIESGINQWAFCAAAGRGALCVCAANAGTAKLPSAQFRFYRNCGAPRAAAGEVVRRGAAGVSDEGGNGESGEHGEPRENLHFLP